jgi:cytokinin dehydrogenase
MTKDQAVVPEARSGPVPELATSPEVITAAADDFGHLVHRVPAAVVRPRTAGEVAELVRYANATRLSVRARGGGHSVAGQAQCDGIVCDLTLLDQVLEVGDRFVSVAGGARWSAVLSATLAHGLTPPVLPDYLELTVGGTLSAGGIGGGSFVHGPQVDHVLELDVVTSSGSLVTCSPDVCSEVFYGALAGQGKNGIITRAVIPVVAAPERVRRYTITVPDLDAMLACQEQAVSSGRFGFVGGEIAADGPAAWTYLVEAGAFWSGSAPADPPVVPGSGSVETEDLSYLDFCERMLPGVRLLASTGDWYRPHPWFMVFLPSHLVAGYVAEALSEMLPDTLGPLPMLLDPLRRGPVPAPGLRTPDGMFYSFSVLRTVRDDPFLVQAALTHNAVLAARARLAGGYDHSISALPFSPGSMMPALLTRPASGRPSAMISAAARR